MQSPEVAADAWAEVTYNETEVVALNGTYDGNGTTVVSVLTRTVSASLKSQTVMTSCLMFTAGVVGNVLALVVLATSGADQRKTLFYKLVAGLALTDLLGTLATSPVVIAVYVNDFRWLGGAAVCHYFSFSMLVACLASMLIVCAMSVERYICVRHPYTYYTKLSRSKFSTLTLVSCWLAALVIAALPLAGVGSNVQQFPNTWCFFDFRSRRAPDLAFNFIFVVTALICIVVTFVCNVSVIYTLVTLRSRQSGLSAEPKGAGGSASSFRSSSSYFRSTSSSAFSSKRSSSSSSSSSMLQPRRRKRATTRRFGEVQMMLMLMGVTIIFTACFAPLTIFVLVCQTPTSLDSRRLVLPLIRIASFNPILDPWVYILFRRELSWRVVRLVRWVLRLPQLLPPGHSAQPQQQMQQNLLSWDRKSELSAPTRNGSIASSGVGGVGGAGKTFAKSKRRGGVLWGSGSGKLFSRHAAGKGSGLDSSCVVASDGSCSSTSSSASSSSGLILAAGSKRKGNSFHGAEPGLYVQSGEGNPRTSFCGEPDDSDLAALENGRYVTTDERDQETSVGQRRRSDMAGSDICSSRPSMFRYNSMTDGSAESAENHHPQKQQRRRAVSIVSFSLDISEPPPPFISRPRRSSALDKVRELPEEGPVPRPQPPRRSLSFHVESAAISKSLSDVRGEGAALRTRKFSAVEGEMRRLSWSDPYNPSCLAFWYQCLCLPPAPRTSDSLAYNSSVREMSCRRLSTVTQRPMSMAASSSDVRISQLPGMR